MKLLISSIVWLVAAACPCSPVFADELPAALKKELKSGDDDARADAVKAAVKQGGADAVALVLPLAAHDKNTRVRDIAFTELARGKDAALTDAVVVHGLDSKDALVRAIACEVLRERGDARAGAAIARALDDKDASVVLAAVEAACFVKPIEARSALERIARSGKDPIARAAAVGAMSRVFRAESVPLLVELARDPDPAVAAEAMHSLGFNDKVQAAARVAEVLAQNATTDRVDVLFAQALRDARRLRQEVVLQPLVGLLEHPRERVRSTAAVALAELTGLEIPPEAKAWREWWDHYGAEFKIPSKAGKSVEPRSQAKFYGMPIASDRVVFVLDLSGSMRDKNSAGVTRIDAARAAFKEALGALAPTARFSFVVFSDEAKAWSDDLVEASKAKVDDAVKFFDRQAPRGKTNLFDGIEVAYTFPDVDTIVVLSDGAPSVGRFQYFQRIRHHVGRMNRARGIAISTVALAEKDDAREFLRELSEATGGTSTVP